MQEENHNISRFNKYADLALANDEQALWITFFTILQQGPLNENSKADEEVKNICKFALKNKTYGKGAEVIGLLACYKQIGIHWSREELDATLRNRKTNDPHLLYLAAQLALDRYNEVPGEETNKAANDCYNALLDSTKEGDLTEVTAEQGILNPFDKHILNPECIVILALKNKWYSLLNHMSQMKSYESSESLVLHTALSHFSGISGYYPTPRTLEHLFALEESTVFSFISSDKLLDEDRITTMKNNYWAKSQEKPDRLSTQSKRQRVMLLIGSAAFHIQHCEQLTKALFEQYCRPAYKLIKQLKINGNDAHLSEELHTELNNHVKAALLQRQSSEGVKFPLVCSLSFANTTAPDSLVTLADYLVTEDVSDVFNDETKVRLLVNLISSAKLEKFDAEILKYYSSTLHEIILPYINSVGCGDIVEYTAAQDKTLPSIKIEGMKNSEKVAILAEFKGYISYRMDCCKCIEQNAYASLDEKRVLSWDELDQKNDIKLALITLDKQIKPADKNSAANFFAKRLFADNDRKRKVEDNLKRFESLVQICKSVDAVHDLRHCVDQIACFLNHKDTILESKSIAFSLMSALAPLFKFDLNEKIKHSLTITRDLFCDDLKVYYCGNTSSFNQCDYSTLVF